MALIKDKLNFLPRFQDLLLERHDRRSDLGFKMDTKKKEGDVREKGEKGMVRSSPAPPSAFPIPPLGAPVALASFGVSGLLPRSDKGLHVPRGTPVQEGGRLLTVTPGRWKAGLVVQYTTGSTGHDEREWIF